MSIILQLIIAVILTVFAFTITFEHKKTGERKIYDVSKYILAIWLFAKLLEPFII